jgi:large subunit ribosomal protein L7e
MNESAVTWLRTMVANNAWGFPNLKSKRCYGKIKKTEIAMTHHFWIAQSRGKYDIICLEDQIHNFYTVTNKVRFLETVEFIFPARWCKENDSPL